MDSDSDDQFTQPSKKVKSDGTSAFSLSGTGFSGPIASTGPRIKPQVAKQQRKDRKQEQLLKKLEKDLYKKQQDKLKADKDNASNNNYTNNASPKKKKKKNKNKDQTENGDNEAVTKSEEQEATSSYDTNEVKSQGRPYSVSIAVAGSIIDNAQSPPLKAFLAGQIARAAAIFNVDEVIIYDDSGGSSKGACELMARILQFMECPQYLRKYLFPIHSDLQYAGVIAPLDIPHHLRKHEALAYREGVVTSKPTKDGKEVSYVYVGLDKDCRVEKKLPEGVRVTVKFNNPNPNFILKPKAKLRGQVVSPHLPRTEAGLYWGYIVRIADSLSKVFTQCPFRNSDGYDLTIGTSEKGSPVSELSFPKKSCKHILIVFGGVEGLEFALENDETLIEDDVSALFDHYVNTCPSQGSRTIRTEEAILISMTSISPIINASFPLG